MKNQKKPKKFRPAPPKKAVRSASITATPHPDSRLINDIAARVKQLESALKVANKKLDFCVDRLRPSKESDESTRRKYARVAETGEALEDEAEEAFEAEQARKK
jgi:hypothetical protein